MGLRPDANVNISGTSGQGEVDVAYADLVRAFGPPTSTGDDYKIDAEWTLVDDSGNVVTIYNYKTGRNYLGSEGLDVEDIRDWHIGGNKPEVVKEVQAALNA